MIIPSTIPRGTTPTIRYTFKRVDVNNIVVAYMTMKQGLLVIEKDINDALIVKDETNNCLEWRLTQAETLLINNTVNIEIQCRWKLNDGTAGESMVSTVQPYRILKEGEI